MKHLRMLLDNPRCGRRPSFEMASTETVISMGGVAFYYSRGEDSCLLVECGGRDGGDGHRADG